MNRKGTKNPRRKGSPDQAMRRFADEMERHKDADALNDNVITPFVAALEQVCEARGYVLNIYGEKSNLAFTSEDDAPAIYEMIEAYLDAKKSES